MDSYSPTTADIAFTQELLDSYRGNTVDLDASALPETEYLEQIHNRELLARFITFGCALDYQRPADRHWQTMWDMFNSHQELFEPQEVVEYGGKYLTSLFRAYGIRFPNNDSNGWQRIAHRLVENHNSYVLDLLDAVDYDGQQLCDRLDADDYPHLTGNKLQPFYCRVLHENGFELSNTGSIGPAIDSQIIRMTEYFTGNSVSKAEARDVWQSIASTMGIEPLSLDSPLWLLGTHLDEWGKEFIHMHHRTLRVNVGEHIIDVTTD